MTRQAELFTIGVEEEYQIVDPLTRALSADVELILPRAQELLGDAVQYELNLSQMEIATPICSTLDEVHSELMRLRQGVRLAANQVGKRIAAAGTHPFSHWSEQPTTPKLRYQNLVRDYQQLIREQVIFGCHVHIGMPDRDRAAFILDHARVWLAPLLALTANSPFWLGRDTGYASFRTSLWWTVPLSGPPPSFSSRNEYDQLVHSLITTKSIEDVTRLYWDIRLSGRFETIEFRVMDVCMTAREAVLVAGLVRALVQTCHEQVLRAEPLPTISTDILRIASWRAARYGLHGDLLDVRANCLVPAHELITQFLEFLRPALSATGDWPRVSHDVYSLLQHGNGASRQLAAYQQRGELFDVVDLVIAETAQE